MRRKSARVVLFFAGAVCVTTTREAPRKRRFAYDVKPRVIRK